MNQRFLYRYTWIVLLGASIVPRLSAQPYLREVEAIPVTVNGQGVALPWAGGINSPNFQFVDIDGDGDLDLLILDGGPGLPPSFYRNEGNQNTPNFKLRPLQVSLPSFSVWFLFVDITGDGVLDLFTDDGTTGMNFYRNDGTPQVPQFVLVEATMRDSAGDPINAGSYSVPAFADIDGDGRIDFFSGNVIGSVNFYRNVGSPTNPLFRFITNSWQNILVISGGPCANYSRFTESPELHGASAFFFGDIDDDGDFDLLWGDLFAGGLYFFRNQGTPLNPVMVLEDTNCFPPNQPVATLGGNMPFLVDIDGDNDLDFFVGVGVVSGAIVQRHGFLFYENIGRADSAWLVCRSSDYLSVLDVGMDARPAFVDIDGDGKLDMFVGATDGEIWHFRNTGTPTFPAFQLVDTAFAGISSGYVYAPAFADIDADGDKDLFIGLWDGSMRFYRNTGTPGNPQLVRAVSLVDTIDVGNNNSPAFVDIDNDGDLDLFIGADNGRMRFYRNTGNATTFVPILESSHYQNITAGLDAKPWFVDIDGDGDFDLFIGTSEGRIEFYENVGTLQEAQFTRRTNHYANTDPMRQAAPAFVDIDGDGDPDLFVGTLTGGIHFYRNDRIVAVEEKPAVPRRLILEQNYPNPFNPATRIRFTLPGYGFASLKVYDILGREVAAPVHGFAGAGTYDVVFDASPDLASGIYLCQLMFLSSTLPQGMLYQARKLILLR